MSAREGASDKKLKRLYDASVKAITAIELAQFTEENDIIHFETMH